MRILSTEEAEAPGRKNSSAQIVSRLIHSDVAERASPRTAEEVAAHLRASTPAELIAAVFRRLVEWSSVLTREQDATVAGGICARYPLGPGT